MPQAEYKTVSTRLQDMSALLMNVEAQMQVRRLCCLSKGTHQSGGLPLTTGTMAAAGGLRGAQGRAG